MPGRCSGAARPLRQALAPASTRSRSARIADTSATSCPSARWCARAARRGADPPVGYGPGVPRGIDTACSEDLALASEDAAAPSPTTHRPPAQPTAGVVAVVAGLSPARSTRGRAWGRQRGRRTARGRRPSTSTPACCSPAPRRRHGRRAPPARARDARRRGPGHRLARLPRRRARGQPVAGAARPSCALRDRITAVVAEVRRSVQTLRTDAEASESLGAAIGGLARHLSESSGIPIRVTVTSDHAAPAGGRVRAAADRPGGDDQRRPAPRRHADRRRCRSPLPHAEIVVQRRRRGLGRAAPDSFGLDIMRERAS